jgi:hypothetical protein
MEDFERLQLDADLDYQVADALGIDIDDLEMCPKKVYDALLRYFDYHICGKVDR